MFQDYALFPHMTAGENVAFGLQDARRRSAAKSTQRVDEALELVQSARSGATADRWNSPGGQRQRVALARALVIRPAVLLLDEPLSNLDLKLREEMRVEIAGLQRRLGITTVFVTHDQGEALVMSDRIAVMNAGRIEQLGTAGRRLRAAGDPLRREFIGRMNFFRADGKTVAIRPETRTAGPRQADLRVSPDRPRCVMSSTSARRSNTTWSWRTESAGWWRRQITAVRRSSRPASACGSVRRQRAAWRCSHHRLVALDGRAQHVPAVLGIVERRGAVLRAAVVPEHRVVQPPAVAVDELRAH